MDKGILNLLPAICSLEEQIRQMELEYETSISPYRQTLRQLKELNQACYVCRGHGKILRTRACAEDDRPDPNNPNDYILCNACKGTGIKKTGCELDGI